MKTNLAWINQEYKRWQKTKEYKGLIEMWTEDQVENRCKLFAAFCLDRLRMEHEVEEAIG